MNLGDIIVPLLIIGGAVVQFIAKNKLKQSPPDTPQERHQPTDKDEWKELMEALGHKPETAPPVPPPPVPVRKVAPPPQPKAAPVTPQPQKRPPAAERPMSKFDEISQREKDLEQLVATQLGDLDRLKAQLKSRGQNPEAAKSMPQKPAKIRDRLREKKSLRELIVLNEILAAPVSTRS